MTVAPEAVFGAIDATWPAASVVRNGPWLVRDGQGGGKRVSAATVLAPADPDDIPQAEAAMRAMEQRPLFMVRPQDTALDAALAARGYARIDPTAALEVPIDRLTDQPVPPATTFAVWEPLAVMREIWAAGGIGDARLAVMNRASVKTGILARDKDRAAGTGFVAVSGDIAMVHAVEVRSAHRRRGMAQRIMHAAAHWAQARGARTMAVLCTRANAPAQALYSGLGFVEVAGYHYRQHPQEGSPR